MKNGFLFTLVLLLVILTATLFYLDFKNHKTGLTFAMLNIGQGDGLFIESPTGTQILLDAGPTGRVMSELSRIMSPFDRSIDAVMITNPDADHIGGFTEVLAKYKVGKVIEPGTSNDSRTYQNLEEEFGNKEIEKIIAQSGMRLKLGGGAALDILFPDRDVSTWDSNDGSIIARLTYGDTSIMLTGDTTIKSEQLVLNDFPAAELDSDILKVAHHGSHTSSSNKFLDAVTPKYALISVGKDNKYGHPHQDVLNDLVSKGIKVLRTDELGTIIMQSDGQNVSFAFKK